MQQLDLTTLLILEAIKYKSTNSTKEPSFLKYLLANAKRSSQKTRFQMQEIHIQTGGGQEHN